MTKLYLFIQSVLNHYSAATNLRIRLAGMTAARNYWRNKYLNTKKEG